MDWNVRSLEDIARLERGKFSARPRNDPKYFGGEYPFIQTGDIANSNGTVTSFAQTLNRDGLRVSRLFPPSTLFFTIAANIGDVAIAPFATACPDSLVAVMPNNLCVQMWLFYALGSLKKVFEGLATQNAQLNINLEKLRPYLLALPSVPEQAAIASVLSDMDSELSALEERAHKTHHLKQAMMQELLTGRIRLS
jgi:type I restriction enzyme S subunit